MILCVLWLLVLFKWSTLLHLDVTRYCLCYMLSSPVAVPSSPGIDASSKNKQRTAIRYQVVSRSLHAPHAMSYDTIAVCIACIPDGPVDFITAHDTSRNIWLGSMPNCSTEFRCVNVESCLSVFFAVYRYQASGCIALQEQRLIAACPVYACYTTHHETARNAERNAASTEVSAGSSTRACEEAALDPNVQQLDPSRTNISTLNDFAV